MARKASRSLRNLQYPLPHKRTRVHTSSLAWQTHQVNIIDITSTGARKALRSSLVYRRPDISRSPIHNDGTRANGHHWGRSFFPDRVRTKRSNRAARPFPCRPFRMQFPTSRSGNTAVRKWSNWKKTSHHEDTLKKGQLERPKSPGYTYGTSTWQVPTRTGSINRYRQVSD